MARSASFTDAESRLGSDRSSYRGSPVDLWFRLLLSIPSASQPAYEQDVGLVSTADKERVE